MESAQHSLARIIHVVPEPYSPNWIVVWLALLLLLALGSSIWLHASPMQDAEPSSFSHVVIVAVIFFLLVSLAIVVVYRRHERFVLDRREFIREHPAVVEDPANRAFGQWLAENPAATAIEIWDALHGISGWPFSGGTIVCIGLVDLSRNHEPDVRELTVPSRSFSLMRFNRRLATVGLPICVILVIYGVVATLARGNALNPFQLCLHCVCLPIMGATVWQLRGDAGARGGVSLRIMPGIIEVQQTARGSRAIEVRKYPLDARTVLLIQKDSVSWGVGSSTIHLMRGTQVDRFELGTFESQLPKIWSVLLDSPRDGTAVHSN